MKLSPLPWNAPLYHLTALKNVESILRNGLQAGTRLKANNQGLIFAITHPHVVADEVAACQLFLREYAIFRIRRKHITGQIGADEVAEFTAPYHRVIYQDHIEPVELWIACRKNHYLDKYVVKEVD